MKSSDKLKFYFCNKPLAFIFLKSDYNSSCSSSSSLFLHILGSVLLYPGTSTFVSRPVFSESIGWDEKIMVPDTKVLVSEYWSPDTKVLVPGYAKL